MFPRRRTVRIACALPSLLLGVPLLRGILPVLGRLLEPARPYLGDAGTLSMVELGGVAAGGG